MSKRPAFQFYVGDWLRNAKLRRCSPAARGAWIDVLCLLHDADEYGVLRWPLADIAQAAGIPVKLLKELAAKGVLKGSDGAFDAYVYRPRHAGQEGAPVILIEAGDGPCWYCSRFVRDEHVRQKRGVSTRFDSGRQPESRRHAAEGTERARLRAAVLSKTGGHCYHCQHQLGAQWEIDHLVPRSKGGRNLFENLVPACVECNQDKADSLPDDWSPTGSPTRRVGSRQGDGASTSTSTSVDQEHSLRSERCTTEPVAATPAGLACARLKREAGYMRVNPSEPHLLAALSAGVSGDLLVEVAREFPSKPLAYIASTALGRHNDAASMAAGGKHGSAGQSGRVTQIDRIRLANGASPTSAGAGGPDGRGGHGRTIDGHAEEA